MALYGDNGQDNANYYIILRHTYIYIYIENHSLLGLYGDSGKGNGSYYLGFRFWGQGYIGIVDKKMETTGITGIV